MPLITAYTNYTTPQPADVLPIVNVGSGTTEKVTVANLLASGGGASTLVPLSAPVTASTVTAATGQFIQCDTTSNSIAVTLPATGATDKAQIGVKMITQGSTAGVPYTVTITCGAGDHFNVHTTGATTMTLSMQSQGIILQYDNPLAVWYVLSDDIPLGQADIRYGSTVGTIAASTGSQNLTLSTAATWNVTLTGNTTFVFQGAATPLVQNLTVYLTQGGSTTFNYTVTWPGSVSWFGGSAPPISTGSGALTVVQFQTLNGGTTWLGAVISNAATPLPVVDGGTGLATLTAYAPLAGGTTGAGVVQQAATGMSNSGYVLTSNGTSALPTWQAAGGVTFDTTATDIKAIGAQSAGVSSLVPRADHVHPPGSSFLCPPAVYAPATLQTKDVTSTTYAAFDSTNINTGSFAAPASGSVVVTFSGTCLLSANGVVFGFALSAHGTAGTLFGNSYAITGGSTTNWNVLAITFPVTGLTPGTTYNFDLCGAAATGDTIHLKCLGSTSTTLAAGSGAPAVLTVQGV